MTLATGLVGDVRHAVGSLFRSPGHSLVVVATLAIAVGAAAAVFAVVREALLRPLPFREPDRLVRVWDRAPDGGDRSDVAPGVGGAARPHRRVRDGRGLGGHDAHAHRTG